MQMWKGRAQCRCRCVLGYMLEHGEGTLVDVTGSRAWYLKAAEQECVVRCPLRRFHLAAVAAVM